MSKLLTLSLTLACACGPLAARADEARFATASDGARIAYYPRMEARTVPVVVLSGGPGTDSRYMRVRGALDRLARTRSVVFYDQRGTSRSSDSDGTETIDEYVEDIEGIRKAVDADRIDLLGHSFGGYLAMAYAAKYPANVRSLVFVDSAPPRLADLTQLLEPLYPDRIGEWRAKRATLGKDSASAESAVFMSMEFVTQEVFEEFLEAVKDFRDNIEVNNTLRQDMARLDYWPHVRRFPQPALVVHGRQDAVVAPSNGWALYRAMPNAAFRIVEGAGHLPHVEKPDAFLAIVQPFLEGLDRQPLSPKRGMVETEKMKGAP